MRGSTTESCTEHNVDVVLTTGMSIFNNEYGNQPER